MNKHTLKLNVEFEFESTEKMNNDVVQSIVQSIVQDLPDALDNLMKMNPVIHDYTKRVPLLCNIKYILNKRK